MLLIPNNLLAGNTIREIFGAAKQQATDFTPLFCYAVSPSAAETIVNVAATLGASRVILGPAT
jgi:hypothetical protein